MTAVRTKVVQDVTYNLRAGRNVCINWRDTCCRSILDVFNWRDAARPCTMPSSVIDTPECSLMDASFAWNRPFLIDRVICY